MSFLDNLESSLKSLESNEEAAEQRKRERDQRTAEQQRARQAAPFAERLKSGAFTADLLKHTTRLGFAARIKVHIAWLGATLRLEARDRKLELLPTAEGVRAVFLENNAEVESRLIDLDGDPEALARDWLKPHLKMR